jgi:hypothetical protein
MRLSNTGQCKGDRWELQVPGKLPPVFLSSSWPRGIMTQTDLNNLNISQPLQKGIFVQLEAAKSWSSLLISPTIKINRGHHIWYLWFSLTIKRGHHNYWWYIPPNPPKSLHPLALVPQEGADSAQDYQEALFQGSNRLSSGETFFPPLVDDVGDSTHHFWCWGIVTIHQGFIKIATTQRMSKPWWLWWQTFGVIPSS